MSFGSRLKDRRNELNITQPQLAKLLGVSQSAVGSWETNTNSPRATLLYDIFDILRCDANYLFQDEMAELYKDSASPEEFENIIKKYRSLDSFGKETVSYILDRELARVQQQNNISNMPSSTLRIYTYMNKIASAGTGYYFDDIPTDTIEAPYMEGADFIIGVNGDSMEPTYSDGDLVYVEKCQIVHTGEIGIFMVDNECLIKEAGESGLISHNQKYPVIPGSESVLCVGKVLGKVNEH